jgi:tetratricopeptide (TPR) repeat protein
MVRDPASRLLARRLARLGDKARDRRDWAVARRYYKLALRFNPNRTSIWVQYGHALKETGRRRAAERAYRRSLAQAANVADTHLQLGHLLKIADRRHEAAAEYFLAVLLDPRLSGAQQAFAELGYSAAAIDGRVHELDVVQQQRASESAAAGQELNVAHERLTACERALERTELQLYTLRSDYQRAINRNGMLAANLRLTEQRVDELARISDVLRADLAEAEAELVRWRQQQPVDRERSLDTAVMQQPGAVSQAERQTGSAPAATTGD